MVAHAWPTKMGMEVTVDPSVDPSELKESGWITKVTKKVTELQDQGRREKQITNDIARQQPLNSRKRSRGHPPENIKLCRLASSWQEGLSPRDYHDYPTRTTR